MAVMSRPTMRACMVSVPSKVPMASQSEAVGIRQLAASGPGRRLGVASLIRADIPQLDLGQA